MSKKKVLAVFLVLVLAMTILAGCGSSGDKPDADKTATGDKDKQLTVGVIYIGPATDGGFSEAQDEGIMKMYEHFGGTLDKDGKMNNDGKVKILKAEQVKEDSQSVKDAALNMIDQGASVVIGTSYGYMKTLDELAKEHPDVDFLHFSGDMMNDTNFGNYFGATEQPRYLTGMVAGLMTKTNKIGYVAAFPNTEIRIGVNAFTLGAQSVNPNVEVKVVYTQAWVDAAKEKEAAEALLSQGCDVLTQHCDTTGPQTAAQDAGAYCIGYNLDKADITPKAFLTAPIWHHEVYYIDQIQKIMDGTWKPTSYYGTIADGYVDIAPMTSLVPKDVQDKVNAVKEEMKNNKFDVFKGPIKDNTGKVRIPDGYVAAREDIWGLPGGNKDITMSDWLVQGATGQ